MKGFSGKEASLPSPLMQEMQVLSPCWEDPLEKQMAALQYLAGQSHGQKRLVGYRPWGPKESDTT